MKVVIRKADDKEEVARYETDTPPNDDEIITHETSQYFVLKTFFIRGTKIVEVKKVMTVG